jgi:hypothetical protein
MQWWQGTRITFKYWDDILKIKHDSFQPKLSQFIIHESPTIQYYMTSEIEEALLNKLITIWRLHTFLTSSLDESEWSVSQNTVLAPESGGKEKNHVPARIQTPVIQPVVSYCADWLTLSWTREVLPNKEYYIHFYLLFFCSLHITILQH